MTTPQKQAAVNEAKAAAASHEAWNQGIANAGANTPNWQTITTGGTALPYQPTLVTTGGTVSNYSASSLLSK